MVTSTVRASSLVDQTLRGSSSVSSTSSQRVNTSSNWSTSEHGAGGRVRSRAVSACIGCRPGLIDERSGGRGRRSVARHAGAEEGRLPRAGRSDQGQQRAAAQDREAGVDVRRPGRRTGRRRRRRRRGAPATGRWRRAGRVAGARAGLVLPQDRPPRVPRPPGRVDAQVAGEDGLELVDGAQRLSLRAGQVLRRREQRPSAFTQWRGTAPAPGPPPGPRRAGPPARCASMRSSSASSRSSWRRRDLGLGAGPSTPRSAKGSPRHRAKASVELEGGAVVLTEQEQLAAAGHAAARTARRRPRRPPRRAGIRGRR